MDNKRYIYSIATLFVGAFLWYLMFIVKPINFWLEMSISILCLVLIGQFLKKDLLHFGKITLRHILIGIISAIGLYAIFYVGNIVSGYLFPFKDAQISLVYGNKSQGNLIWIGLLLFFVIGPGEEIYWRGFIQNTFAAKFGENNGFIFSALIYGGIHIATGNFMLVLASLVCGIYWGWIYKKEKSLVPVIISHAIWDLTIFVLLPMQ